MPSTARIVPRDSSRNVFVRLQTTTGASPEDSALNGPPALCSSPCPSTKQPAKCSAGAVHHKVFSLHKRCGYLQRHDHEKDLHCNRDGYRLPVKVPADRLTEHHGDVDHGNECNSGREFLRGTLDEHEGQDERNHEGTDQRLAFLEGPCERGKDEHARGNKERQ